MKNITTFDISIHGIIKIILVLLALWFLFIIRDIIAIVFGSIIIASALNPVVDRLSANGIPRPITIALAYLIIIGGLGATVYFIIPPMIDQLRQLADPSSRHTDADQYQRQDATRRREEGPQHATRDEPA